MFLMQNKPPTLGGLHTSCWFTFGLWEPGSERGSAGARLVSADSGHQLALLLLVWLGPYCQPPAGSLGVFTGQQQHREGQEDTRPPEDWGEDSLTPCAAHSTPNVSPGAGVESQPGSGGRRGMLPSATRHCGPVIPPSLRAQWPGRGGDRPDVESCWVFNSKHRREWRRAGSPGYVCLQIRNKSFGQWSQFSFCIFKLFFLLLM